MFKEHIIKERFSGSHSQSLKELQVTLNLEIRTHKFLDTDLHLREFLLLDLEQLLQLLDVLVLGLKLVLQTLK